MTAPANGTHQDNGHILHNLMMFGETLRKIGLDVGSGNMLDLVRALEYTPIGRKQDFQQAARSILVHRKQDIALFDEAFQVFWRRPASGQTTRDLRSLGEQRRYRNPQVAPPRGGDDGHGSATEGDEDDAGDRVDLTRTYSAREVLRQKDFSDFDGLEIAEAKRVMSDLSWDLGNRRTRRTAPGDGSWIDLRRTLRQNLKYGGELLELPRRVRKDKPRPLILICDVSGSMERYTRMLLHFIHAIAKGQQQAEAFLFATRLTRVTGHLRHQTDPHHPLLELPQHRSGGHRSVPGGPRLGRGHSHRASTQDVQFPVVAARPGQWSRGAGDFRRVGPGRAGIAVPGDFPPTAQLPPPYLAQPVAGVRRLPTVDPGNPSRATLHRRLFTGQQPE